MLIYNTYLTINPLSIDAFYAYSSPLRQISNFHLIDSLIIELIIHMIYFEELLDARLIALPFQCPYTVITQCLIFSEALLGLPRAVALAKNLRLRAKFRELCGQLLIRDSI